MVQPILHMAATEASGLGSLGINIQAFLVQLVTFLLFIFILEKVAIKPLLRRLEARRKVVDDGVLLGLKMQQANEALQQKIDAALQEARAEADRIIEEGRKAAQALGKEVEAAARQKAERLLADANERIKDDAARARAALEQEVAALVGDVAEAVIGQKLTTTQDQNRIKQAIKEQVAA